MLTKGMQAVFERPDRMAGFWLTLIFTGLLTGPGLAQQAADSQSSSLYREMKVRDPESIYVPPLAMRRIIQLPAPWADPLAPEQSQSAGKILSTRMAGTGIEVETGYFFCTVTAAEGDLHLVIQRKGLPDNQLYPALAVKEARPALPLAFRTEAGKLLVQTAEHPPRVLLCFDPADGGFTVPRPPDGKSGGSRYRAVFSNLDQRLYLLSALAETDRILGLGMKGGSLDRRGRRFTLWNSDSFGYHENQDPLYSSIPFFLQTATGGGGCRGLFVDDASDLVFDFGYTYPEEWFVSTANGRLDLHIFTGSRLADVLASYQALTGTAPLPPVWALGYHQSAHTYYPADRVLEVARTFREKNIPADALYLDIIHQDQYRPFTWNPAHFPDPPGLTGQLHRLGFKVLTIIDPGIQVHDEYPVFAEGRAKDYFLRTGDGRIYANNVWPGYSAFPDFLQGAVRQWWAGLHRSYLEQGVDAFKNDMSEPATFYKAWSMIRYGEHTRMPGPLEEGTLEEMVRSRSAEFGELPHRAFHNAYGLYEAMATARAQTDFDQRRPFVLMRNTFASGQRYTSLWTGDIGSDWASFRQTVPMLLSLNLSGFPVCGADSGGFAGRCTPELFARWTAFSAFSPFFRTHYFYVDQCLPKEPWSFGPAIEKIAANFIRTRYRLLPYLYTELQQALATRAPLMKPLPFVHEDDPAAWSAALQYYLGDALLVAPVAEAGARGRFVYLPAGEWYDFWTGTAFTSQGESRHVEAPLEKIPVFVRGGTILPAMEPGQNTAEFPPRRLILECYLDRSAAAAGTLYLDDGASRQYEQGKHWQGLFRIKPAGKNKLELLLEGRGGTAFQPRQLTLQIHGAARGCRTVRWQNREYPLTLAGGISTAILDMAGVPVPD